MGYLLGNWQITRIPYSEVVKLKKILSIIAILFCANLVFANSVSNRDANGQTGGQITNAYARSHQGQLYQTGHLFQDVTPGASINFLIDISTESFTRSKLHYDISVFSEGKSYVSLFSDPTITGVSSGTVKASFSVNDSTDATDVQALFYHTGNFASSGTAISPQYVVSSGTVFNEGNFIKRQSERIAVPATEYLVEVINKSADAIDIGIYLEFYEVE